jgi:hypothetical protein
VSSARFSSLTYCTNTSKLFPPIEELPTYLPLCATALGEAQPDEPKLVVRFLNKFLFTGCHSHAQPPTWRATLSLLIWTLSFDLSGMGDPTGGIALQVTGSRKSHHHDKVGTTLGGNEELKFEKKKKTCYFAAFLLLCCINL